jgi:predicted flap endonuclease-1-like 5' DNA nuclease
MWESLRHSMEIGALRHRFAAIRLAGPVVTLTPHTAVSHLEVRVGWFIAQSLAFIIIAALIGLAIGIWIGWLVWGRQAKGKHAAEKAEAAARTAAVAEAETAAGSEADAEAETAEPAPALAVASTGTAAEAGVETPEAEPAAGTILPVADSATGSDESAADAAGTGGVEAEVEAAGSDVVAEAEAVARKAAEAEAAAKAAAAVAPADEAAAATEPDDLQRIEGIGPKIASALIAAGYPTYASIAASNEEELRQAVAGQGIKFAPAAASWADQAQYLVDSDTKGLDEYQDYLVGGQERRAKFSEKVDYADVDAIADADAKAAAIAQDEAETAAVATAEPEPEPEPEPQDLQRIEGIGPKIEAALKTAGYTTYAKVAGASEAELREALTAAGIKFAPAAANWADQAQYLVDGDEDGLREYQDYLVGGQERRAKFSEKVDYADVDEIADADAKAEAIAEDEAEAAAVAVAEPEPEPQDLQRIEGIGPKIEAALKAAGYTTYAKVAAASEAELREAVATGGIKFAPAAANWAHQAQYLADGDEDGLKEFQDYLVGGQDRAAKFKKDVDYADVDEISDPVAKVEAIAEDEAEAAAVGDDTESAGSGAKA